MVLIFRFLLEPKEDTPRDYYHLMLNTVFNHTVRLIVRIAPEWLAKVRRSVYLLLQLPMGMGEATDADVMSLGERWVLEFLVERVWSKPVSGNTVIKTSPIHSLVPTSINSTGINGGPSLLVLSCKAI